MEDFELAYAFLADVAQIIGGKIYVLGGGVSLLWAPNLPAPIPVVLVMQINFRADLVGTARPLRVEVIDSDGNGVLPPLQADVPVPAPNPSVPEDMPVNVSAVIPFPPVPVLQRPGGYEINITLDGKQVKSLPLHVVRGSAPQSLE